MNRRAVPWGLLVIALAGIGVCGYAMGAAILGANWLAFAAWSLLTLLFVNSVRQSVEKLAAIEVADMLEKLVGAYNNANAAKLASLRPIDGGKGKGGPS